MPESIGNLATALLVQRRLAEAEPLVREEMQLRDLRRHDSVFRPAPFVRLASVLGRQGNVGAAETLLRDALAELTAIGGANHPEALRIKYSLARLLHAAGKTSEAEELLRELLPVQRRMLGDDAPYHYAGPRTVVTHRAVRAASTATTAMAMPRSRS